MPPHTYFQIPQFILDDWLCSWDLSKSKHMEIICTQPRQLSAIGVAERVAEERAEKIGGTVGYQVTLSVLYNTLQL
jgi:ATP-dependent RNA helicase DHX57